MNRRTTLRALLALGACLPLLSAAPAQAPDVERLNAEFVAAYRAEDWPTAIARGSALAEALPREPVVAYNLACVHARAGQPDPAVKWLARSVELGFDDVAQMRSDPDLDSLRGTEGYAAALRDAAARGAGADPEFEALLAASEPLIVTPPGHDPAVPATVIVALHGYGVDATDIADTWREPAAHVGAVLVAPRTVRRAEGTDGFTWGPDHEAERIVLRALEQVRGKLAVDPGRVVVTGFSQGGHVALEVAARNPGTFRGVIPVAAFRRSSDTPVPAAAGGSGTAFYVVIGAEDRAAADNRALVEELRSRGHRAQLVLFEGLGHAFPPDPAYEMHRALHFVLD